MKTQLLAFAIMLFNFQFTSCQTTQQKMERFDWSHAPSAPKGYPMRILRGTLKPQTPKEYSASFGLWGEANEGWGRESGMVAVGPDLKAVPDSLVITWLSLREKKFYTGRFKLPTERMTELFREGYYDYELKIKETYKDIIVGMAPGGVVVVWLLGGQVETEVARFQAVETEATVEMANDNTKDMFKKGYCDFVLNDLEIKQDPIPFGLWDTYREKYTWRPKLVLPKGCKLFQTWATYFNGEKEHTFSEDPTHDAFKKRALPMELNFTWHDATGKLYYGKDFFDEAEIFEAFRQIYSNDKEQEAELIFTLNDNLKGFSIKLRGKTEEIELEKVRNKTFPTSD